MRSRLSLVLTAVLLLVPAAAEARVVSLKPFDSCSSLLSYARGAAIRELLPDLNVVPFTGGGHGGGAPLPAPNAPVEAESKAGADGDAVGPSETGTNVQEAGVDEPDVVKTDGRYVYALARGVLEVVDTNGGGARRVARLRLVRGGDFAGDGELLLAGGKLLHLVHDYLAGREQTLLTLVDVADPTAPRVERILSVDGGLVTSRLTGAIARVVVRSSPAPLEQPSVPFPSGTSTRAKHRQYAADVRRAYRRQIRRASVRDFLPRLVPRNRRGRATGRAATAVPCDDVRRPRSFAGLETVTVLTIDLARGLDPVDSDAVLTAADVVYASPSALYVASLDHDWLDEPSRRARTALHKFALDGAQTTYRGSGDVPGYLLNQFSLSERDGVLRVASTQMPTWFEDPRSGRPSESFLSTLTETSAGGLATLARIEGLGKDERIYAVRFIGDQGYVVTFRETDPLYVIDVRDPRAPKVTGELKIRGYSAYLHPIGDGLLLGIGQDATVQGRRLGAQLSVFDVSDPARPARLHQRTLGALSEADVEYDHRAFLYWPATGLTVLPVFSYEEDEFTGAYGFRVGRAGIADAGRISHAGAVEGDPYDLAVRRTLVVGDRLISVSSLGLRSSRLDDLSDVAFVAF